MLFNTKNFGNDKKIKKKDRIFVSNRNFTTIHIKISQIPGFSRFSGNPGKKL